MTSGAPWNASSGSTCKGYSHESVLRIATNIVIYSTLP